MTDTSMNHLAASDPAVASAIAGELTRQRDTIELIASENFTSPAVLEAVGSAAGTTRGFSAEEFREIGGLIAQVVFHADDEAVGARVRARVEELLAAHPLYPELG